VTNSSTKSRSDYTMQSEVDEGVVIEVPVSPVSFAAMGSRGRWRRLPFRFRASNHRGNWALSGNLLHTMGDVVKCSGATNNNG
jgi:hypothetical protein